VLLAPYVAPSTRAPLVGEGRRVRRNMNPTRYFMDSLARRAQTAGYVVGLISLLSLAGYLVFGWLGVVWVIGVSGFGLAVVGKLPVAVLLRLHRARALHPYQAPRLHRVTAELARRAGLRTTPALLALPGGPPQAFAALTAEGPVVGVTPALVSLLDEDELAGVLAHEISHIAAGDTRLMAIARVLQSVSTRLAWVGWLWLLLAVLTLGVATPSVWPATVLIAVPVWGRLLELALSRTREFGADLEASRLTGDPLALASALSKLEAYQRRRLGVFAPALRMPEHWSSHPATPQRIARLEGLAGRRASGVANAQHDLPDVLVRFHRPMRVPRVRQWHYAVDDGA